MKSFVANTTISFEGYRFYVRPGDMLSYDTKHGNSLTIYRNGQLVKVLKVIPLVIEAFIKSKFISEVKPKPVKEVTEMAVISTAAANQVAEDVMKNLGHFLYPPLNDLDNTLAAQVQMDALAKQADIPLTRVDRALKRRRAVGESVPITPELAEQFNISPPQEPTESQLSTP